MLYAAFLNYRMKRSDQEGSGLFGGILKTRSNFPYERHDIIKSTNWYRKELKMKNWRIMGDITLNISMIEPRFKDPHTLHILIRQVLENYGCIIEINKDPTVTPLKNSLLKDVSYHIDGGIKGYIGKRPKKTMLFLGMFFMFLALVCLMFIFFYFMIALFIICLLIGIGCLLVWRKKKTERSFIEVFLIEEGTYYVDWQFFGIGAEKKVQKMPKQVEAELFITIGILPDLRFSTMKGKNLFSDILEDIRRILQGNDCKIIEQHSSNEIE